MSHKLTRCSLGFALLLAFPFALSAPPATATPVISAGNLPFSGISPGGVDMSTGELILVMRPDLVVDGPFPLMFRRYYASMLQREGFASSRLGPNWLHSYDWKLSVAGSNATLVTNRGEVIRFTMGPVGGWNLVSPTYAPFKLDQLPVGTWRVRNPIDRRIYFFDGTTWLLNQILDEHGNPLTLTYAVGGGPLIQVSDGLGRVLNFSYSPVSGLLTQVSDGTRNVNFSFTGGVLTSFTDAAGKPWSYANNPGPIQALITGVTEPMGNTPMTHSYDPLGRVASQMDALGHTALYAYDTPTGNIYTDPQGNPWTYQHDPLKLTSLKDPNGGSALYTYDPLGRLDTYKRPMGDPTSFTYDPASGYIASMLFVDGNSMSFDYAPHIAGGAEIFDVRAVHYPDGTNANYDHDPQGNLINYLDQAGFPWMGTYNSRGQILTWTNPGNGSTGGGTTTFTYDPQGRPATVRDNAGNTASYIYDPLSRLTQVDLPGGAHRKYTYDNRNNVTQVQDENGNPWNYAYDDNGRVMTATDPLTHASGFVYDPMDRVSQVVDPLGHAALYDYDLNGRLFHLTDRSGRVTTYQYDALNRLQAVLDPAGAPTSFGYDGDSRMTFEQDPLGHSSTFQYDFMDRLTKVIDPVSSEFDYSYDPMGRLHGVTGPLGFVLGFGYDPRGLLTSASNGTSTVQYQYTPHRRLSQVTDPNGNPWPYNYDPQGRLTSSADPLGRTTGYEYDERSRLMRINLPDLTQEQITHDGNGNVTGESFTDGTNFICVWDAANRMTSASPGYSFTYDNGDRMTTSNGFSYTYDFEGRLLSETLAPGMTESYSYDPRGLLSQVSDWAGGNTMFNHDAAHRLTGISRPNGTTADYLYDAADRMTSAVEKQPGPSQISSIQITRDALGRIGSINRFQPLMPGATMPASSSFSYDIASQVNGVSHDALGRTTVDGTRALSWNGASQLTTYAKSGADSLNYTDDGSSNPKRIQPPHPGGVNAIDLAWGWGRGYPTNDDMAVSLPSRWRLHVRTPSGLLLYGVDGASGARSFYHYDEAGNTAYLTNDGGHVTTEYAYGPFGGVSALGQTTDNLFTFGAARGMMALTTNGVTTGLWKNGGGVYDERTMRVISGNAVNSGSDASPEWKWQDVESPQWKWQDVASPQWKWQDVASPQWKWQDVASPQWKWQDVESPQWKWQDVASPELNPQPFYAIVDGGLFMHELGHNVGLDHGGGMSDQLSNAWENNEWIDNNCDGELSGVGGNFDPKGAVFRHFGVFGHSNTSGLSRNSWDFLLPPWERKIGSNKWGVIAIMTSASTDGGGPKYPPPTTKYNDPWLNRTPVFTPTHPGPYGLVNGDTFTSSGPLNPCAWCPR